MPKMSQPRYLDPQAFAEYCRGPIQHMLSLLSLSLKPGSQKLQQVGARALGYRCYEALAAIWQRKEAIIQHMYAECCPVQANRLTIKAGNILVVYDERANCFLGMALRPGEEGRKLTVALADHDELAMVSLPEGAVLTLNDATLKSFNADASPAGQAINEALDDTYRATFHYQVNGDRGERGVISFLRTHEGVIVDVYDTGCSEDGDSAIDEVIGSFGIMFTDRQENEVGPEQVNLYETHPQFGGRYGEHYRWYKTGVDDNDDSRLLHLGIDDELDFSDLIFNTADEAILALESEDWGTDLERAMEDGAVLVKITQQIVPSPV